MFTVKVSAEIVEKLKILLSEEGGDVRVRLRTYTIGQGWHAKTVLGPSIDEINDMDDVAVDTQGIPFIASEEFLERFGNTFEVVFEEDMLRVHAVTDE